VEHALLTEDQQQAKFDVEVLVLGINEGCGKKRNDRSTTGSRSSCRFGCQYREENQNALNGHSGVHSDSDTKF
jgi:hypothetical protein